jgi:hypothetical protein
MCQRQHKIDSAVAFSQPMSGDWSGWLWIADGMTSTLRLQRHFLLTPDAIL